MARLRERFWKRVEHLRWQFFGGIRTGWPWVDPGTVADLIGLFDAEDEWTLRRSLAEARSDLHFFAGLPPLSFPLPEINPRARGLCNGPAMFVYELIRIESRSVFGKPREERLIFIKAISRRAPWSFSSGS